MTIHTVVFDLSSLYCALCCHCKRASIWLKVADEDSGNLGILIHPKQTGVSPPHADMPEEAVRDYEEARQVLSQSPRASAALLRLAIEKICTQLGDNGKRLNDNIKLLVKRGLPKKIQQALDVVRVVGNESVHPGQIDLNDDRETAASLFELTNIIVDVMIAEPRRIEEIYEGLPETKRKAIEQRDQADDA